MYKTCTRNEVNLGDYMPSYKPLVRLARFASQPTRISCEYAANLALAIRETRKTRVSFREYPAEIRVLAESIYLSVVLCDE